MTRHPLRIAPLVHEGFLRVESPLPGHPKVLLSEQMTVLPLPCPTDTRPQELLVKKTASAKLRDALKTNVHLVTTKYAPTPVATHRPHLRIHRDPPPTPSAGCDAPAAWGVPSGRAKRRSGGMPRNHPRPLLKAPCPCQDPRRGKRKPLYKPASKIMCQGILFRGGGGKAAACWHQKVYGGFQTVRSICQTSSHTCKAECFPKAPGPNIDDGSAPSCTAITGRRGWVTGAVPLF